MTKEKLQELLNNRSLELSETYQKDKGYDYCRKYTQNNNVSDIADFTDIDIWYLMKCLYYINNTDKDIEEIENLFETFKPFFEASNIDTVVQFIDMTLSIDEAGNIDNVINYLDNKNIFKSAFGIAKEAETDYTFLKKIQDIKKFNRYKDIDMANYFRCYKEQGEDFLQIMYIYKTYRLMLFDLECLEKELENHGKVKEKDRKSFIRKMYKDLYEVNRLIVDANRVKSFVDDEDKKEKQSIKNNSKELFNLNSAMAQLEESLKEEEVTNARSIVSKIKDLNIKYAVLELISEHNSVYYEKLDRELNSLNKNSKIKYQALLHDYGIINGSYQIERIMNNSLEDVEQILKIISKYNLTNEQIIKILRNSTLEIVSNIKEYLDKGYLSLDFIIDNIDIYYRNSTKYQVYNNSLSILSKYNINPSIFFDSISVLFTYSDSLENNLELLDNYNLLNSLKTTSNYKFLINDKLAFIIDKLIELGYEEYLEEDLDLLNNDKLMRLEALKAFEVEISNKEELDKVLNKRFYINDEDIEEYLPEEVKLDDKYDLESIDLNEYKSGSRTYNINGILISSNKVNRLLNQGYSKYNAIFSGMRLNTEEYNSIIGTLKGIEYHK